MLHESIGHLGIFVSAEVAGREHDAVTDTMGSIAAGLCEMRIEEVGKRLQVRFEPRRIADILALAPAATRRTTRRSPRTGRASRCA